VVVFVVGVVVVSVAEVIVTTFKLTGGLFIPYIVAVISLFPAAIPVTKPPEK
jgi:phage shock protein PspC (stress-responsive transcriptional regulator)